ncbi:MAG: DUF4231 domain-containing protein [Bacteroidia bacterium]|nr:DUF4231 domain-containing protein [Bacteroidia bacterium]
MDLTPARIKEIRNYVSQLDLEPSQKELLKIRWLDTIDDYEKKAKRDVDRFRWYYLTALVASLLIPFITNLNNTLLNEIAQDIIVSILGVLAALAAGLNQLINYRKRWAFYRQQSHLIKQEGFAFLSLTNQYKEFQTHKDALKAFLGNVERTISESIKFYQDFLDTEEEDSMISIPENAKTEEKKKDSEEVKKDPSAHTEGGLSSDEPQTNEDETSDQTDEALEDAGEEVP